jgi:hypothetical protein
MDSDPQRLPRLYLFLIWPIFTGWLKVSHDGRT